MTNNVANSPTRNVVLTRKSVLRDIAHRIATAYLEDLHISKFGPRASFAIQVVVFLNHVSHVVQLVAKKQVSRVNARRDITVMQDTHSNRDRAMVQFPGDTVSKERFVLSTLTNGKTPIAILITATSPQPTSFSLLNMRPKALFKGLRNDAVAMARSGIARFAAILASVYGKDALLDLKGALALLALDNNAQALAVPGTSATAKKTLAAFMGDVDKFLSAAFTDANMRGCVKMVLHANSLSCATPRGASNAAGASSCFFPLIIPQKR